MGSLLVAMEAWFKEEAERNKSVKDIILGLKALDLRREQLQVRESLSKDHQCSMGWLYS